MTNATPKKQGRAHNQVSGMIFGMLIVGVGVLLLLDRGGVLSPFGAWDFWPLALVFFGFINFFLPSDAPHRVFGVMLIGAGAVLQLYKLDLFNLDLGVIWPVFVILFGIYVFWATWYQRRGDQPFDRDSPNVVSEIAIFGGGQSSNRSKDFQGGEALAIFGGCDLDLTRAEIQGDSATLYCRALFGGVDIRVPEEWEVVIKGIGILGGYEDKTRHINGDPEQPRKQLIVKGYAMFGGVDLKN